jgi:deazaflavin-dependent oxidoreductase (nitroreductase family)
VLIVRTTGGRSGKIRETTVLYERDGDHYVVIGSNTGSERAPAWSLNLLANPEAEILVGGRRMQVRASEASGPERARLIDLMDRRYHGFEAYRARTDRELRSFSSRLASRSPSCVRSTIYKSASTRPYLGCSRRSGPEACGVALSVRLCDDAAPDSGNPDQTPRRAWSMLTGGR